MLHLPYPIVNVLTKMDNLKSVGGADLPFNLDFYTEVQDLHHLLPLLTAEQAGSGPSEKWDKLNEALIGLIEDFGLVGFETLAVEDRASMASLIRAIDRASGYIFAGARATDESGRTLNDEASIWAQAMSDHWAGKMDVRDVQERWIDRKEEFDEEEMKQWAEEAKMATATPSAQAVRKKAEDATSGDNGAGTANASKSRSDDVDMQDDEDDDELIEQQRWHEEQSKSGEGGAARVLKR